MEIRYRDDEDGGGPRILESQPEYSQDAQRVDDELSASFDDSTNVRSKDFISRDISREKFILPIYNPPFSIIRNMTNKGQGRTVFDNCAWSLGPNMASY